jgi:hypothetical protein
MRFQVFRDRRALNGLADIWTRSRDRRSVTQVVDEIDKRLRTDPFNVGESRESTSTRVAVIDRLGVQFKIIGDDAAVRVIKVFSTHAGKNDAAYLRVAGSLTCQVLVRMIFAFGV